MKDKNKSLRPADRRTLDKTNYDETKEKDYGWFSKDYDEEPFWEDAAVDGVTFDGQPLDGTLWNKMLEELEEW